MISDAIGSVAKTANETALDPAKQTLTSLQELLAGPQRKAPEIQEDAAKFIRGENLSTPDGGDIQVAATPGDGKSKTASSVAVGKLIEFIHFGRVHRDAQKTFGGAKPLDDSAALDLSAVRDNRAVLYRAALEREAVLLAGFARSVEAALAEKDAKEGGMGDLLTAAADLVGGAGGTAGAAASADMKPFVAKVEEAWKAINKPAVDYAGLHDAGKKLHVVRANLLGYLHQQLEKEKDKKAAAAEAPKGVLSSLPLVGELPIPGVLGDIVGFMQKVTGKLHDVQVAMIFGLTIGMQPAIEAASEKISLDAIRRKRSPIYPIWYLPPEVEEDASQPLAELDPGDVLSGNLLSSGPIADAAKTGADAASSAINDATAKPMEIIDFLSQDVKPAPGHPFLDEAFQIKVGADGIFGGSGELAKIAVTAFYNALTDDVPSFLDGFVRDVLTYVFSVCIEFLRAVYRVLASMQTADPISTQQLVAAGSAHILTHLIDYVTEKLGLDELLGNLELPIPDLPSLPGINWPVGNNDGALSVKPIIAALEAMLVEKVRPAIEPVVEYVMSGLAGRLNAQRMWATNTAMTMEVHLAQLPTELALMFRNLFGPLWSLLTDTIMGAISDALKEVLGPASDALDMGKSALGSATDFISDAQKKAQEAQAYAKNVEDKAGELIDALSSMSIGTDDPNGLDPLRNAAGNLADAVGADPFSDGSAAGGPAAAAASGFPANRKNSGKGTAITTAAFDEVAAKHEWEKAEDPTAEKPPEPAAGAAGAGAP